MILRHGVAGEINPSRYFRKHFDLYANIRPARTFEGAPIRIRPFDLVVVRENTEGFLCGPQHGLRWQ